MKVLNDTVFFISKLIQIDNKYIYSFVYTVIAFLILKLISKCFELINNRFNNDDRNKYTLNQRVRLISSILFILCCVLIWQEHFQNILTLISFVSAALTLAVRDMVFNFFSGLYIKINKPFSLEDRIDIAGNIGDVININYLSFEILEVKTEDKGEQSTGIIIRIPSSKIFSDTLKNYSKGFKYIWKEINVTIPIDSDIEKTKKELYKILSENEILKSIPRKMKKELNNVNGEYRIYYNNLDPIIYTSVDDNKIILSLRFLVHPKKTRIVESDIWNNILIANKKKKIVLFND